MIIYSTTVTSFSGGQTVSTEQICATKKLLVSELRLSYAIYAYNVKNIDIKNPSMNINSKKIHAFI